MGGGKGIRNLETKIRKSVIFLLFCFVFCFNTTEDLHITKNTNGKHYTCHVSYCSLSPLYIDTLSSYSSFYYTSVLNDIIIIGKKLGNLNFSICVLHILTTVMFALSLSFVCLFVPLPSLVYYIIYIYIYSLQLKQEEARKNTLKLLLFFFCTVCQLLHS